MLLYNDIKLRDFPCGVALKKGMTKLKAFSQESVQDLPRVSLVEFIGSVVKGNFVPGRSDLDVFVHRHMTLKKTTPEERR